MNKTLLLIACTSLMAPAFGSLSDTVLLNNSSFGSATMPTSTTNKTKEMAKRVEGSAAVPSSTNSLADMVNRAAAKIRGLSATSSIPLADQLDALGRGLDGSAPTSGFALTDKINALARKLNGNNASDTNPFSSEFDGASQALDGAVSTEQDTLRTKQSRLAKKISGSSATATSDNSLDTQIAAVGTVLIGTAPSTLSNDLLTDASTLGTNINGSAPTSSESLLQKEQNLAKMITGSGAVASAAHPLQSQVIVVGQKLGGAIPTVSDNDLLSTVTQVSVNMDGDESTAIKNMLAKQQNMAVLISGQAASVNAQNPLTAQISAVGKKMTGIEASASNDINSAIAVLGSNMDSAQTTDAANILAKQQDLGHILSGPDVATSSSYSLRAQAENLGQLMTGIVPTTTSDDLTEGVTAIGFLVDGLETTAENNLAAKQQTLGQMLSGPETVTTADNTLQGQVSWARETLTGPLVVQARPKHAGKRKYRTHHRKLSDPSTSLISDIQRIGQAIDGQDATSESSVHSKQDVLGKMLSGYATVTDATYPLQAQTMVLGQMASGFVPNDTNSSVAAGLQLVADKLDGSVAGSDSPLTQKVDALGQYLSGNAFVTSSTSSLKSQIDDQAQRIKGAAPSTAGQDLSAQITDVAGALDGSNTFSSDSLWDKEQRLGRLIAGSASATHQGNPLTLQLADAAALARTTAISENHPLSQILKDLGAYISGSDATAANPLEARLEDIGARLTGEARDSHGQTLQAKVAQLSQLITNSLSGHPRKRAIANNLYAQITALIDNSGDANNIGKRLDGTIPNENETNLDKIDEISKTLVGLLANDTDQTLMISAESLGNMIDGAGATQTESVKDKLTALKGQIDDGQSAQNTPLKDLISNLQGTIGQVQNASHAKHSNMRAGKRSTRKHKPVRALASTTLTQELNTIANIADGSDLSTQNPLFQRYQNVGKMISGASTTLSQQAPLSSAVAQLGQKLNGLTPNTSSISLSGELETVIANVDATAPSTKSLGECISDVKAKLSYNSGSSLSLRDQAETLQQKIYDSQQEGDATSRAFWIGKMLDGTSIIDSGSLKTRAVTLGEAISGQTPDALGNNAISASLSALAQKIDNRTLTAGDNLSAGLDKLGKMMSGSGTQTTDSNTLEGQIVRLGEVATGTTPTSSSGDVMASLTNIAQKMQAGALTANNSLDTRLQNLGAQWMGTGTVISSGTSLADRTTTIGRELNGTDATGAESIHDKIQTAGKMLKGANHLTDTTSHLIGQITDLGQKIAGSTPTASANDLDAGITAVGEKLGVSNISSTNTLSSAADTIGRSLSGTNTTTNAGNTLIQQIRRIKHKIFGLPLTKVRDDADETDLLSGLQNQSDRLKGTDSQVMNERITLTGQAIAGSSFGNTDTMTSAIDSLNSKIGHALNSSHTASSEFVDELREKVAGPLASGDSVSLHNKITGVYGMVADPAGIETLSLRSALDEASSLGGSLSNATGQRLADRIAANRALVFNTKATPKNITASDLSIVSLNGLSEQKTTAFNTASTNNDKIAKFLESFSEHNDVNCAIIPLGAYTSLSDLLNQITLGYTATPLQTKRIGSAGLENQTRALKSRGSSQDVTPIRRSGVVEN